MMTFHEVAIRDILPFVMYSHWGREYAEGGDSKTQIIPSKPDHVYGDRQGAWSVHTRGKSKAHSI